MSFGQGLSGLAAASDHLDVVGNNIANIETAGFKSGDIVFSDVYASSRVGLGVKVAGVNQNFGVGNINAGGQYDIAIDGTNGLFRLADSSGAIFYSRNGQFQKDSEFYIVNQDGYRLTGYAPGAIGGTPVPVRLPQGNIAPKATTNVTVQTNLDANATVIGTAGAVVDPSIPTTFNDSLPITVYDSLGNSHPMMQCFVKRPAIGTQSVYEVFYTLDGLPATGTPNVQLRFDVSGRLVGTTPANPTLTFTTIGGVNSPAQDLSIALGYNGVTQYGSNFNPKVTQNGYPSGALSGVSFAKDGSIIGNYTNGQTQGLGTVALAQFNNVQGLQPVGNNNWIETGDSGGAILGQPGTNGLPPLVGQAYEGSNVNMNKELVQLIIAQRDYQANAKTIETQNNIMQTLLTRL